MSHIPVGEVSGECSSLAEGQESEGRDNLWRDLERRRGASKDPLDRNQWCALLLGQFIALAATSQNAASFTLEYGLGHVFPFFLMLNIYACLSLHLLYNRGFSAEDAPHAVPFTSIRIRAPWWYYLCLAILDMSANFLTLMALKHTSLTSSTLLGSMTVPSTMLVCRFLLAKSYTPQHFLGAAMCVTGGLLTIWSDVAGTKDVSTATAHPHSYYGDMLALFAAVFYGIGDAAGEFCTKHVDRKEYLGMLGLCGSLLCLVLVPLFEREAVLGLFYSADLLPALGVLAWYIPSLLAFYIASTLFLVSSDATLLILSLQSSNLWAIVFSVLAYHEFPPVPFYGAVVLVVSGVFVYELLGNSSEEANAKESPSTSPRISREYMSIDAAPV